jgi:tetratricopeptide (TPR) repeat protein
LVRPSLLPDLGSDGEESLEVETPLRWAEHCHPRGEAARYEVFGYLAQAFDTLAWEHPDARVTWSLGLGESLYYAVEQTVVSPENFRSGQFLQIEHWLQWATQLSLQQRYQEAVDIYEKVLLRDPTNAYAYEYRAFNRQRLGVKPEMLLVDYHRAVQIRPHVMLYQKRYIESLIRVGRFKEAWWQMNEATDQCAADPGLYTFLYPEVALAFWEQGRTEEAARILNRLPCEYQQDRRIQEVRDQLLGRDAGGRINPFPSLVQPDRATVAQVFQELDQILSGV